MALCLPCEAVAITGDLMAAKWVAMGRGPVRSCQDPRCSGVWVGPEDPKKPLAGGHTQRPPASATSESGS